MVTTQRPRRIRTDLGPTLAAASASRSPVAEVAVLVLRALGTGVAVAAATTGPLAGTGAAAALLVGCALAWTLPALDGGHPDRG